MTRYKLTPGKSMTPHEQIAYFCGGSDQIALYINMLTKGRIVEKVPNGVNVLEADGTPANDGTNPKSPYFNPGQWRSVGFCGFPVGRLLADGFLTMVGVEAAIPAPVVPPDPPRARVKVDNRKNDGPCPVCGTRTVEFSCFTSISYICPQCKC